MCNSICFVNLYKLWREYTVCSGCIVSSRAWSHIRNHTRRYKKPYFTCGKTACVPPQRAFRQMQIFFQYFFSPCILLFFFSFIINNDNISWIIFFLYLSLALFHWMFLAMLHAQHRVDAQRWGKTKKKKRIQEISFIGWRFTFCHKTSLALIKSWSKLDRWARAVSCDAHKLLTASWLSGR